MSNILVNNFIRQLHELQEGSPWFDQSLRDKLNHLDEATAFARPHPALHSVAEHVSHMLEWRKECILRFNGGKTELMHSPADWRTNEELKMIGWRKLLNAFYDSTQHMIALIEGKPDEFLDTIFMDTDYNYKYLVEGIIEHDIYHLGQIGITLKFLQVGA